MRIKRSIDFVGDDRAEQNQNSPAAEEENNPKGIGKGATIILEGEANGHRIGKELIDLVDHQGAAEVGVAAEGGGEGNGTAAGVQDDRGGGI